MLRKLTYYGVFEPSGNGSYSVYFPDLPGCVSCGDTLDQARENAQDALGLHLYGMEQDGDEIPAPAESLQVDSETESGYLICPVTVFPSLVRDELDNRRVKTNVTIPAWVRELAQERGYNCSKLLEEAILDMAGIRPVNRATQDRP